MRGCIDTCHLSLPVQGNRILLKTRISSSTAQKHAAAIFLLFRLLSFPLLDCGRVRGCWKAASPFEDRDYGWILFKENLFADFSWVLLLIVLFLCVIYHFPVWAGPTRSVRVVLVSVPSFPVRLSKWQVDFVRLFHWGREHWVNSWDFIGRRGRACMRTLPQNWQKGPRISVPCQRWWSCS